MKRRMVAGVALAMAIAGQVSAQSPNDPTPIRPDVPGRATVSSPITPDQKPVEGGGIAFRDTGPGRDPTGSESRARRVPTQWQRYETVIE